MTERLPWFRMYADAIDNEKLRLLAFEDRWHFVALLCLKRRGLLDEGDSEQLRDRKISIKLGLGSPELSELKRRLMEVVLVDENWQPIGWEAKQYESDSSAERTRRYRERRAARDVTVTSQSRHGDGGVTASDTDTDAEVNPSTARAREGDDLDQTGEGSGNAIHDWHRVAGINPKAFREWLKYMLEHGKRIVPSTAVSMAKTLAYWQFDQQPQVVEIHRRKGWKNLRNNVDVEAELNGTADDSGKGKGSYDRMMEAMGRG